MSSGRREPVNPRICDSPEGWLIGDKPAFSLQTATSPVRRQPWCMQQACRLSPAARSNILPATCSATYSKGWGQKGLRSDLRSGKLVSAESGETSQCSLCPYVSTCCKSAQCKIRQDVRALEGGTASGGGVGAPFSRNIRVSGSGHPDIKVGFFENEVIQRVIFLARDYLHFGYGQ